MWQVWEHKRLARRFRKLPVEIIKRYEKWKDVVASSGPQGLRAIRGFQDEALRGEWKGCRSSRLSQQYRVIYWVDKSQVLVEVIDVNAHDYKTK